MNHNISITRKGIALIALCLLCSLRAAADIRITLRSGETLSGTVIFENAEVIVVRDKEGVRYQYMKTEITAIEEETDNQQPAEEEEKTGEKKVGVVLQIGGGATTMPGKQWGGRFAGDLRVGACNLMGKHIFLGGGIGYHAYLLQEQTYGFVPLQLNADIPFMQGKHAPFAGLSLGYGFSTNKKIAGGMYAGLNIGWRYAINERMTLLLSVSADFQQCTLDISETIEETDYTRETTQGFCTTGAKIAFCF